MTAAREYNLEVLSEDEQLPSPVALTEQHLAALERAIRAEGYSITVDTETGEVELRRQSKYPPEYPNHFPEGTGD